MITRNLPLGALLATCLAVVMFPMQPVHADQFRRGDANGDVEIGLTDAIFTLGYLFFGTETPLCLDAADSDDSGVVELTDAVFTLGYVFLGTAPPPAPGPGSCGSDPTADDLGLCVNSSCPPPIDLTPASLPENRIARTVDDFANALVHDALTTIFNSPGDSVDITYGGNVSVAPWPGIPVVVELETEITATLTDDGAHELAISRQSAGGIGVELWDGLEAQAVETKSTLVVFRFEDVEGLIAGLRSLFTRFLLVPIADQAVTIVANFEALVTALDDAVEELALAERIESERAGAAAAAGGAVRAIENELAAKRRELNEKLARVRELERAIDAGCGAFPNPACDVWRDGLRAARRAVDLLEREISALTAELDAARAAEAAANGALAAAVAAVAAVETAVDEARQAVEEAREVAESARDVLADLEVTKLELDASFFAYELRKGVAASVEVFLSPFPGVTVEGAGIGGALEAGAGLGARVEFDPGFRFRRLALGADREVEISGTGALGGGLKGLVNLSSAIEIEFQWDGLDSVFRPVVSPTLSLGLDTEVRATAGLLAQFEYGAGLESGIEIDLSQASDIAAAVFGLVSDGDIAGLAETLVSLEATATAQGRWIGAGVIGVGASYLGYGAGIAGSASWIDVGEELSAVVSARSIVDTLWSMARIDERLADLAAAVEAAAE